MDAAACFDRFRLRLTAAQQKGDGGEEPARKESKLSREPRQLPEELAATGSRQRQKHSLGGTQGAGGQGSKNALGHSNSAKEAPAGIADALGARAAAGGGALRKDALRSALSLMKGMRGSKSAQPEPTTRQKHVAALHVEANARGNIGAPALQAGPDRQASQSQGAKPSSSLRPQQLQGCRQLTCCDEGAEDAHFDEPAPEEARSLSRSSGGSSPKHSGPVGIQHGQPWHSGMAVDEYFAAARRHLQTVAKGANDIRPGVSSSHFVELLVAKLDGDLEGLGTNSRSADLQQLGAESQVTQPTLSARLAVQPKGSIAHCTSSLRLRSHLHSGPSVPPQRASGSSRASQPQQQQRSRPASNGMPCLSGGLDDPQSSFGLTLSKPFEVACDRHSGPQQQGNRVADCGFLVDIPFSMPSGTKQGGSEATGLPHNKRQKLTRQGPWEVELDGDVLSHSVSAVDVEGHAFDAVDSSHLHAMGTADTSTAGRVKAAGVQSRPCGSESWQAPTADELVEEDWLQDLRGHQAQRQVASISSGAGQARRQEEPAWLGSSGLAEEPLQHAPPWKCGRNGEAPSAVLQLPDWLQHARPQGTQVPEPVCLQGASGGGCPAPDLTADEDDCLTWLAAGKDRRLLQSQRLAAVPDDCAAHQGRGLPDYLRLSPEASQGAGTGTAGMGPARAQHWEEPVHCSRRVSTSKDFATSSHSLGSCRDPSSWLGVL